MHLCGYLALPCAVDQPGRNITMPRYRVTLRRTTIEIVEASNPYQAAIVASDLGGGSAEIASVVPALGRPPAARSPRKSTKATKNIAKKRRPMSPEARAKLAQNLVKARAARARNLRAAKKTTRKTGTKNVKRAAKRG
jgi:hypothetical protein